MVDERLTKCRSSGLRDAFELNPGVAERRPAGLEVAVLIVGRAGRREQHDRLLYVSGLRIGRRKLHRALKRAGDHEGRLALQRTGKLAGRLADQVGLADAREVAGQRRDAYLIGE